MNITYCEQEKLKLPFKLPAWLRYKSKRIRLVALESWRRGSQFRILSGRYGLISAWDRIPYYNQRLKETDVEMLLPDVIQQLDTQDVRTVVFYYDPRDAEKIVPYVELITRACEMLEIPFGGVQYVP